MRIRRLITICLAVAAASMCFTSLASATDPIGGGWTDPAGGGWTDPPGGGWQAGGAGPNLMPKSERGVDGLALAAIAGGLTLLVGGTAIARRRRTPSGLAA